MANLTCWPVLSRAKNSLLSLQKDLALSQSVNGKQGKFTSCTGANKAVTVNVTYIAPQSCFLFRDK